LTSTKWYTEGGLTMKVVTLNEAEIQDPRLTKFDPLYELQGEGTIYVSHKLPPDKENWVLIDYKHDLHTYSKTHNLFLKTAKVSHQRMLFRSLLSLNETPITPTQTTNHSTVPSVSTCTCTAPAGRRTKICNSCDHYEIESQICERYPRGLDMENVSKWKCGEFRGCLNTPLETHSRKDEVPKL